MSEQHNENNMSSTREVREEAIADGSRGMKHRYVTYAMSTYTTPNKVSDLLHIFYYVKL